MSKPQDLAARAAAVAARPRQGRSVSAVEPGEAQTPRSPTRSTAPRAKPVRISTDLDPQRYRALLAYCGQLAETLGRAKVANADVIRALLMELERDDQLQAAVARTVGGSR